jgi:hypothetical protein
VIAFAVTLYLMRELKRSDEHPVRRAKVDTIRRTPAGGFETTEEHVAGGIPSRGEETEREPVGD